VTVLEDQEWRPTVEPGVQLLWPCPPRPEQPVVLYMADARFIEPLNDLTDRTIREVVAIEQQKFATRDYSNNLFKAGHMNYLVSAIRLLYMLDRPRQAQAIYDKMIADYKLAGDAVWDKDLDVLLAERLLQDGGKPIASEGTAQVTAGLVSSLTLLAVANDDASMARARFFLNWARKVHMATNAGGNERTAMARFDFYAQVVARNLLISPEVYGLNVDLQDRAKLWRNLPDEWKEIIYDSLADQLAVQCEQDNIDFEATFPEPPGMDEFRQFVQQAQEQMQQR